MPWFSIFQTSTAAAKTANCKPLTANRQPPTANRDNLQFLWRNRKMYRGRAGDVSVELHRHRLITQHLRRRNLPVFYIRQVRVVSNEDTLQIAENVDVALVFEN